MIKEKIEQYFKLQEEIKKLLLIDSDDVSFLDYREYFWIHNADINTVFYAEVKETLTKNKKFELYLEIEASHFFQEKNYTLVVDSEDDNHLIFDNEKEIKQCEQ